MTKVMVTSDCSPLANEALAHACSLAGALGAELMVVAIQPDPDPPLAGEFGYIPSMSPAECLAQEQSLRRRLECCVPGAQVRVVTSGGRSIPRAILDVAREEGAHLLVMSTHGRSGLGRALMGSVAEAVAHHSPIPVMLVRAGQPVTDWSAGHAAHAELLGI
ncbi:hypothetical protein GCM10008955_04070 [Deinococcus malanensis]|uniref:UspA domain-containing protein n=1 Tax=Deinococcus malanensis TaxID=1706855 RepID=A0ABQ2ELS0_9DEIO|nr:universal stress protein [Deinococcus malanensis]GGK13900.1 hypothetical protein GCM10008955_04070 [Deinococcus malanensis]